MICKICNTEFVNLGMHLHQHNITAKDYYDKYIKTDENEGLCRNCNKPVLFKGLTKGYRKFCSKLCCNTSEEHRSKMISTIISNYGGLGTASKAINSKIKETNIKKYGTENVYASEYGKQKIKETCLAKYGTEYANQSFVVKEKIVKTSLERYNMTNPGNCKSGRQKAAITMRGNDNHSSWEDLLEQNLLNKGIIYEKQYSDKRYPFLCDFYLPDSDTFIEINGYWSHNNHFFDEHSKDDQDTLLLWINKANKGHKQYKNAVYVWSVKDKQKHEAAIKHNLNYFVLWTYTDLLNYCESL